MKAERRAWSFATLLAACLCLVAPVALGAAEGLSTAAQFRPGEPIRVELEYRGGIDGWDGGASVSDGVLMLSNAFVLTITTEAGRRVEPLPGKLLAIWADTTFRDPFRAVVDLRKHFDLSRPGSYVLQWGCKDVRLDRIRIVVAE